jgi:hypothetical protein
MVGIRRKSVKGGLGKVHKRHMKALVNKNTRKSIGRKGLRHAKQVGRADKKHNPNRVGVNIKGAR